MTGPTEAQILARYRTLADADPLDPRLDALIKPLDVDTMRRSGLFPAAVLRQHQTLTYDEIDAAAGMRLSYAVAETLTHAAARVARSIAALGEYAWVLDCEQAITAMDTAPHDQVGAPKLAAFAAAFAIPYLSIPFLDTDTRTQLDRMAHGQPCQPDCRQGCVL